MHPTVHHARTTGRTRLFAVTCALTAVVLTGCTSSGSSSKDATTTTVAGGSTATAVAWTPKPCERDEATAPKAVAVEGSTSDFDVTSFDGTTIRAHWFPLSSAAETDAPTVFMGPGWGMAGDTNTKPDAGASILSVLTISSLQQAGYNVLTWDPRGFGESTGTVKIDSVDFEAKDVSTLIDWVAAQKGVQTDVDGDPRMGMVGASYGGGIQFVSAAIDCRIDAITPTIAWNSLGTSLYKADTVKSGWADVLVQVAPGRDLDPHILSANEAGQRDGNLAEDDRQFFLSRGPDDVLAQVRVPTLIVQGTVDTLFTPTEGDQNFTQLAQNDIPLAMIWFCGGHGACLNKADPAAYVSTAILGWLDRYVKGDDSAPVVPTFQTVDQNAKVHTFDHYPVAAGTPLFAMATEGTLPLQADGGSGPATSDLHEGDVVGGLALSITPAKATNAVDLTITNGDSPTLVLGAPTLRLAYSGTVDGPVTKATRIFAQLVDDETGKVVGTQITPVPVILDGKTHALELPLEMVAFDAKPGAKLTLQLVASTVVYAEPQFGGTVNFSRIELTLPTVAG